MEEQYKSCLLYHEEFIRQLGIFADERNVQGYCFVVIGIEKFEHFGAWYGKKAVPEILGAFESVLLNFKCDDVLVGCMNDDKFAVFMPENEEKINSLFDELDKITKSYVHNVIFRPRFGIYSVEGNENGIDMYRRAVIALKAVKDDFENRICKYDKSMLEKIERENGLIADVHRALENGEFTFYLQPQYNMPSGKIIGMEALVRWIHPQFGIIPPGSFLPLLEKNGLITNLDMYLWDKVCAKIRSWIDEGINPVPISVNVSRVDLYNVDVVECFKSLVEKYNIEHKLLEIEITENAYMSDNDRISKVVDRLRAEGFVVLMDDFGSAYSSLNMLKNVNVDVLKLDMKFLELEEDNLVKGFGIVETVLRMARFMGIRIVMEGVETEEQLKYLVKMGCVYGQGYYMDRPMPIEDCEKKIRNSQGIDYDGIQKNTIGVIDTKELMRNEMFSEIMVNSFIGGLAVFEVFGEDISIIQMNDNYQELTGLKREELDNVDKQDLLCNVHVDDRERILEMFDRAYKIRMHSSEAEYRKDFSDGEERWIRMKVFFLREQDGKKIFCGSAKDVTVRRKKENELRELKKRFNVME